MQTKKKAAEKKVKSKVKNESLNNAFNGKAFSADIIATREKLDLSQAQAAKIAGVSQVTIFTAEAKMSCSLRSLPGICNLIGKPIQHYFTSSK